MPRWIFVLSVSAVLCSAAELRDSYFDQNVAPVLAANCGACHGGTQKTSGFSIASVSSVIAGGNKLGTAVISGDPAASPLIKLLKGQVAPRMPLGKTMAEKDIAVIEEWIRQRKPEAGLKAKAPDWLWPYKPP